MQNCLTVGQQPALRRDQLSHLGCSGGTGAYLHHESTPHSVEGVGEDPCSGCHCLRHSPLGNEVGVLLVRKDDTLGSVIQPEVCSSVHDDTLHASLIACQNTAQPTCPPPSWKALTSSEPQRCNMSSSLAFQKTQVVSG